MINNSLKVVHLDGMVIRGEGFVVDLHIKHLAGDTRELTIAKRPSNLAVHIASYTDEDGLDILIENLEIEASEVIGEENTAMCLNIARRIEAL